ncbi:MAG TPA: hypothetical protein VNT79_17960 [Phycisphaerae bacterium]|nr:hypothetical protein [Phycisphaerae bacterium]
MSVSQSDCKDVRNEKGEIAAPPASFWGTTEADFPPLITAECEPALKRLGPLSVSRSSFPLMGLFASVYEHVANAASEQLKKSE